MLFVRWTINQTFRLQKNGSKVKKIAKLINSDSHSVIEAVSSYHYKLAYYLLESGIKVSIEIPLSVNHFIQIMRSEIKTDMNDVHFSFLFKPSNCTFYILG